MFASLFARRRARAFHWKPALDAGHGRYSLILTTFPTN